MEELQTLLGESERKGDAALDKQKELFEKFEDIRLGRGLPISFVDAPVVVLDEPLEIDDINNEVDREGAFFKQAEITHAVAMEALKDAGEAVHRPLDYYAEMLKTDDHMFKVRKSILEQRERIERSLDRRQQRFLKKHAKQIEFERKKELHASRKSDQETLKKLIVQKEQKQGAKRVSAKRDAKNKKFGSGGKKRGLKRNSKDSFYDVPHKKRKTQ